jgi:peptidoglycan/LPS O-acetylase OafA/YrhL
MRRIPELDSLRGIAALSVLLYHFWPEFFPLGWSAVDLFFCLSGYLITSIILANLGTERFTINFYARRSLRIWPIYYLTLIAVIVVSRFQATPLPLDGLPYYLTYTQNIQYYWFAVPPPFPFAMNHTWTLALEEQFYLIWPALVSVASRRGIVLLSSALVMMSFWARLVGFNSWILLARCDGFALGGLLAAMPLCRSVRIVPYFCAMVFISLSVIVGITLPRGITSPIAPLDYPAWEILAVNLFYAGILGLTVIATGSPVLAALRARPLRYLGQISYGLYLYHPLVEIYGEAVRQRGGLGDAWWWKFASLVVCLLGASLSWRLIESPILGLKHHFEYRAHRGIR